MWDEDDAGFTPASSSPPWSAATFSGGATFTSAPPRSATSFSWTTSLWDEDDTGFTPASSSPPWSVATFSASPSADGAPPPSPSPPLATTPPSRGFLPAIVAGLSRLTCIRGMQYEKASRLLGFVRICSGILIEGT